MKTKLIAFLLFFSPLAMALNFYGVQSVTGLNTTRIFTAPTNAYYFVNGQLAVPNLTQSGFPSYVVAVVSKNQSTQLYQGLPGATGFQLYNVSLSTNDYVTVALTSAGYTVTGDAVLNSVQGQVYFGNTF